MVLTDGDPALEPSAFRELFRQVAAIDAEPSDEAARANRDA